MNILTLVRGLPGSGKSTLARSKAAESGGVHIESDMYFIVNSEYKFDALELPKAHSWCLNYAVSLLSTNHNFNLYVANNFTTMKEMQPYIDLTKAYGCNLEVIECKGDFGSIHNVPEHIIKAMKERWEEFKTS